MTWLQPFFFSLTFLTRIGLPRRWRRFDGLTLGTCAGSFPLVGILIGLVGGVVFLGCLHVGITLHVASLVAILCQVLLTGGLHEDGLADTADALGGHGDRQKKLAIMKDSHIGSFGVLALILIIGMKASAMATLGLYPEALWGFAVAASFSRAGMAVLMHLLPPARDTGLAVIAGKTPRVQAVIAVVISVAFLLLGLPSISALIWVGVVFGGMLSIIAYVALRQFGGITGDVLGAAQVLTETALFIALLAYLRS